MKPWQHSHEEHTHHVRQTRGNAFLQGHHELSEQPGYYGDHTEVNCEVQKEGRAFCLRVGRQYGLGRHHRACLKAVPEHLPSLCSSYSAQPAVQAASLSLHCCNLLHWVGPCNPATHLTGLTILPLNLATSSCFADARGALLCFEALAELQVFLGDATAARATINTALRTRKPSGRFLRVAGLIEKRLGDLDAAAGLLKRSVAVDPRDYKSWLAVSFMGCCETFLPGTTALVACLMQLS
jgi:hypothetical protein